MMMRRDGGLMPNYTKHEAELLSEAEQALTTSSRAPALTELTDDALVDLISALEAALAKAGPRGEGGVKTKADLLKTALNRASAERRKRGLKPRLANGASAPAPKAAADKPAKPVKAAPGSALRKPAGRKKAEARKDLRTGSRRVAKAPAKADVAPAPTTTPAPEPRPTVSEPPKPGKPDKAARKAQRQAEKAAAKEARKAEKQAVRAAEKAERKAGKEAEKAARKAERQAAREKPAKKGKKAD